MKTRKNMYITIIAILGLQSNSCDTRTDVAVIKNKLATNILAVDQPNEIMTDSILYYGYNYLEKEEIESNQSVTISVPGAGFQQATNNEKVYIYVFSEDSLVKYRKLTKYGGILKKSLIKKMDIQLNQIKYPLDTINIR